MVPAGKAEVLCCYTLSSSHLFSLQMVFVTCLCVACVPALPGGHKPLVRVKEDMILLTWSSPFPPAVWYGRPWLCPGTLPWLFLKACCCCPVTSLLAVVCFGDIHCKWLVASHCCVLEALFWAQDMGV